MSAPIRFGYLFDFRNPAQWHRPWGSFYVETLEFISWLETIGFETVWFPEHHGVEDGYMPSPLIVATAVAMRTKRMTISPGVALAPLYHPVRLAEDMAVLDIVSGGRAELAVGVGYLRRETDAYGANFERRGKQTDELLQIVKRLWAGETVTFDGEFFRLKDARIFPLPLQKSIPLLIGGVAKPGYRRAARYGDGYLGGGGDNYSQYMQELRACGKGDKDVRFDSVTDMWMMVSEDPEKTLNEIAPYFYYQVSAYAEWQKEMKWGVPAMDFETFKKSGIVSILTPQQTINLIRKRREEVPDMRSFGMMVPPGLPLPKLADHAELFAKKVLPAFR